MTISIAIKVEIIAILFITTKIEKKRENVKS